MDRHWYTLYNGLYYDLYCDLDEMMAISDTPSYETLPIIDDYLGKYQYTKAKWNTLSEDDRRDYVFTAMGIIDSTDWVGDKLDPDQDLEWPRDFDEVLANQLTDVEDTGTKKLEDANGIVPEEMKESEIKIIIQFVAFPSSDFDAVRLAMVQKYRAASGQSFEFRQDPYNPLISKDAWELMKWFTVEYAGQNQPMILQRMS